MVRGPDVLWGGDIRRFYPPAGVFDGVIGGPPCQSFSRLAIMTRSNGHEPTFGNLIPEFERCVQEAQPRWFLMENVKDAPVACVHGYATQTYLVNNRWFADDGLVGAEQNRKRRLSFGTSEGRPLEWDVALFEHNHVAGGDTSSDGGGVMRGRRPWTVTERMGRGGNLRDRWAKRIAPAVTAGHGGAPQKNIYVYSLEDACELQGLPRDFTEHMPFRKDAKLKAVANGVPLPLGRAIARAVRRAMRYDDAHA